MISQQLLNHLLTFTVIYVYDWTRDYSVEFLLLPINYTLNTVVYYLSSCSRLFDSIVSPPRVFMSNEFQDFLVGAWGNYIYFMDEVRNHFVCIFNRYCVVLLVFMTLVDLIQNEVCGRGDLLISVVFHFACSLRLATSIFIMLISWTTCELPPEQLPTLHNYVRLSWFWWLMFHLRTSRPREIIDIGVVTVTRLDMFSLDVFVFVFGNKGLEC